MSRSRNLTLNIIVVIVIGGQLFINSQRILGLSTLSFWSAIPSALQTNQTVNAIDWNLDGKIAIAYDGGVVEIQDALGKHVNAHSFPNNVVSIAWSRNPIDILAVGTVGLGVDGEIGSLWLWNAATNQSPKILPGQDEAPINQVGWNADGSLVAVARQAGLGDTARNYIEIWNAVSGQRVKSLDGHLTTITSIAWCPGNGNRLASSSADGNLIIWDVATGKPLTTILVRKRQYGSVASISWSFDGSTLALVGADSTVQIWNANTYTLASTFPIQELGDEVAWSPPNGSKLAVAELDRVFVLDAHSGQTLIVFQSPNHNVIHSIAWSPDGSRLAYGGSNTTPQINWIQPTSDNLRAEVNICVIEKDINNSLMAKIDHNQLQAFINEVNAQSGKKIEKTCANQLILIANYLLKPTVTLMP